jgi:hypothetical protein
MPSKLPIGGLKCSNRLVQLNLSADGFSPIGGVLDQLADSRINLAYVTLAVSGERAHGACALAAEDWGKAEPLLSSAAAAVTPIMPVGTLTLYPHRWRPELLKIVLGAFARSGVPVYCAASSLASLTVATDYRRLDTAISAVKDVAQLPDNHAPFETPWRIEQI